MKVFSTLQKYSIYLFAFSVSFESMNILNINFLATKISLSILFFFSVCNYKSLQIKKPFLKILVPLLIYFILLSIRSYMNQSAAYNTYIDFLFFLNILLFVLLVNYSYLNPNVLLKSLFVFVVSNIIITFLYFLGIGLSDSLEGRVAMLGMNENYLGLSLTIAFLSLMSIVIDNKLDMSKNRFLLLLFLPLLLILIIKSGSRGALLGTFLGIFVFVLFNKSIKSFKKLLLIFGSIILLILVYFLFLRNSYVVERLIDTFQYGDTANRDLIWEALTYSFSDTIIWGVGKTGYGAIAGDLSPHNVLLEVFLYTGVIGLIVFLFFYYKLLKRAFSKLKYENEILPIVLLMPITILLFTGQFFDKKFIWLILAYVAGSSNIVYITSKSKLSNINRKKNI